MKSLPSQKLDMAHEFWYYIRCENEAWLSLVERYVRDAEAVGSSPVASIH